MLWRTLVLLAAFRPNHLLETDVYTSHLIMLLHTYILY